MQYKIESIGTVFKNKDITNLEERFSSHSSNGYNFHSVFQITQPGCLGLGRPSITYLAVYVKE